MDEVSFYYACIKFLKSVLKFASAMIRNITSDALIFYIIYCNGGGYHAALEKIHADAKSVFSWSD